jgi:pimeloyl-ACP methyl ester carboxylesterase
MEAATQYAQSGDVFITYQVVGDGPFDVVLFPGGDSHVEFNWQVPIFREILTTLASFSRLIVFDKRGTGMSDRVAGLPDLETRMDDVRAVMDTAGSERRFRRPRRRADEHPLCGDVSRAVLSAPALRRNGQDASRF